MFIWPAHSCGIQNLNLVAVVNPVGKKSFMTKRRVDSQEIRDLMWGYLSLNKHLSQRRLARIVVDKATDGGVTISAETVQRAFGAKALNTPYIIKKVLVDLYAKAGVKSQRQIGELVKVKAPDTQEEFKQIESARVVELMDLWLATSLIKSRRQLAFTLRDKLVARGYQYHLGSLQNIFCGKIKFTRSVVYEALKEILIDDFFKKESELKKALVGVNHNGSGQFNLTDAGEIPRLCAQFLKKNPKWTKRKLAIELAKALKAHGYTISNNSLQYILAGKRRRAKKIIITVLSDFLGQAPGKIPKEKPADILKERRDMIKEIWQRRLSKAGRR